jgi:hypothetical protein
MGSLIISHLLQLVMLLQVFINTELYARVSVAVLFHQLWKQIKEHSILETEEALECGKLFLLELLDSAVLFCFVFSISLLNI